MIGLWGLSRLCVAKTFARDDLFSDFATLLTFLQSGSLCPSPPPPKQHHHVAPPTYISVRPLVALARPFLGQSFVPLKNPSARTIATTNATTPTLPTTFPTTLPTTVSSGRE